MLPIAHLLIGIVSGLGLFKLGFLHNLVELIIFVFATVLIDIDHFLYFLFKLDFVGFKKIFKAAFGFKVKGLGEHFYFMHSPELNIILFFIGLYYHIIMVIFVANAIHITCDVIWDYYQNKNWKLLKKRSIIGNIKR